MNRKTIIWIVVAVFVVLVGFRIVTSKKKGKIVETDTSKPVYVQKVARGTMQTIIMVSGNIKASQQADIFSRVPGKLISNLVEEGDFVKENQEIALIDRDEIGVAFSTGIVKSTISGILLKNYIDPGAKVDPAKPIATVGNISTVKAVANLPENDFVKVKRGTKAYISLDAYPDTKFTGEIVTVTPQIDLMSRTGQAEILIDNSEKKLKPGMFATIYFLLAYHSGVIVIPRGSVIEDGDIKKAFVVENGKAKEKILSIGLYDDNKDEVLGGLKEGEELIVDGHRKVKDGDTIRVIR
jgi:multidrug efflux pump subunit AcrA (membrane-fusion protein)